MNWSNATRALAETAVPEGYELTQLRRHEVGFVTDALRRWYPDIVVGAESRHLDPDFYYRETLLEDVTMDRTILPVVAKRGDELAGLISFEKNELSRTITCRLGAVAPEHRSSRLGLLGPVLLENLGRAIGAELAYYFATLKTRHQQVLAERHRYDLVGIVPAFDRDMVRPGEVKRVYEAIYAKVLVPDAAIEMPNESALTARTRAVWRSLFGRAS